MFEDSLAPQTRYDLSFRLGDIPVRVHPYFWLTTGLLGLDLKNHRGSDILVYLLVWMAIVFVSVLVHELGHILMGRYFGRRGHIILTSFCGLAVGCSDLPERWKRIAVSLAGPGAGFLLAGVVVGLIALYNPSYALWQLGVVFGVHFPLEPEAFDPNLFRPLVLYAVYSLLWINIFWGLVNLLPIWPLDGGHVCREICEAYRRRHGARLATQISLYAAGGLAVLELIQWIADKPLIPYLPLNGGLFGVLFFGLLAWNSWQLLQFIRRGGLEYEQEESLQPWERDADWWKQGGNSWRD